MIPNENEVNKNVELIATSVMRETLIRCKSQRIPTDKRAAYVSANNARAVCLYMARLTGEKWNVGVVRAEATNRAHRDNERFRRATVATVEPLTPFPADTEYSVRFGPNRNRHFVAVNAQDIIDPTGWRWRADDGTVQAPNVVRLRHGESCNADFLDKAYVESYIVHAMTDEPPEYRLLSCAEITDIVQAATTGSS